MTYISHTFEFVLHFVKCHALTVSPNLIIINIIIIIILHLVNIPYIGNSFSDDFIILKIVAQYIYDALITIKIRIN